VLALTALLPRLAWCCWRRLLPLCWSLLAVTLSARLCSLVRSWLLLGSTRVWRSASASWRDVRCTPSPLYWCWCWCSCCWCCYLSTLLLWGLPGLLPLPVPVACQLLLLAHALGWRLQRLAWHSTRRLLLLLLLLVLVLVLVLLLWLVLVLLLQVCWRGCAARH
jgi:hypothetical protein